MEYFVETHLCKLRVIRRSRVLRQPVAPVAYQVILEPGIGPVAQVAYQVILQPGIGQFREFAPRRVHTRGYIRWDFFLWTN